RPKMWKSQVSCHAGSGGSTHLALSVLQSFDSSLMTSIICRRNLIRSRVSSYWHCVWNTAAPEAPAYMLLTTSHCTSRYLIHCCCDLGTASLRKPIPFSANGSTVGV